MIDKKNPVNCLLALALICLPAVAVGGEFASWWLTTPGGSTIGYEKHGDKYQTILFCNTDYGAHRHLLRWYFFNNHIVGTRMIDSRIQHFIFNESTCVFETYSDRTEFENRLKAGNLVPRFWTRWYDSTWGVLLIADGDLNDGLAFTFFIVPSIFLFSVIFLFFLIRSRFDMSRFPNRIGLLITACILIRVWLDVHPDSM